MTENLIEALKAQFPVRDLEPYGEVVIVPRETFQHSWEKDLEAEGYRVFAGDYEGHQNFFIRLLRGKPKKVSQIQVAPVSKTAPLRAVIDQNGRFAKVPLALLESCSDAPREVFEEIDALANTIRQHGLLEPLIVASRKDRNAYEVVAGERRLRACRKAVLETVPCIVLDGVTSEQVKELQLIENMQRKDLKPFEEIRLVQVLSNRGLDLKEIAVACGLSHGAVQNYLTIARALPIEVQRTIEKDAKDPRALTLTKALILAQSKLEPHILERRVELIKKEGASASVLLKKIAKEGPTKIHRVRESRAFWRELMKTLREYATYWSDFAVLKVWEDVSFYHAELSVKLPKDLKELEAQVQAS